MDCSKYDELFCQKVLRSPHSSYSIYPWGRKPSVEKVRFSFVWISVKPPDDSVHSVSLISYDKEIKAFHVIVVKLYCSLCLMTFYLGHMNVRDANLQNKTLLLVKFTQESCQVQLHFSLIRHWQFSEGYLFCSGYHESLF